MTMSSASSCLAPGFDGKSNASSVMRARTTSNMTASRRYRLVIPKDVREKLGIRPGQGLEAFAVGNRIVLVPVQPLRTFRARLADLPPLEREPDRP